MLKSGMETISECVLNFSEGRRRETVDAVVDAAAEVDGVFVLQIDSHKDANRTVVTFAGNPDGVCEAAFRAVKTAAERIDMRFHRGTHARIGAADVVPIVPVKGLSLADAVSRARELGERIGGHRRRTASAGLSVRRSGARRTAPAAAFHPPRRIRRVGGAHGRRVSSRLWAGRFQSPFRSLRRRRAAFYDCVQRQYSGRRVASAGFEPHCPAETAGRLKAVQAKPWFSSDFGMCQMTANLFDFRQTGVEGFFEAVKAECIREGLSVDGSELVGLIPAEALLQAADFYGFPNSGKNEADACAFAGGRLGLNRCRPFVVRERVFEFAFEKAEKTKETD